MKNVKLFLTACLILVSNLVWSQANINNVNLSYYNQTCDMITVPITADLCAFNAGDVISGTLDFGDGTVINLNNYVYNPQLNGCDTTYFESNSHWYATPNTYTLTAILNGPNATSVTTTMVINSSNCFYFSGNVFNDLNGNCIQDIGELPCSNVPVEVAFNNFTQLNTSTDINGHYILNSTAYATSGYTVKVSASQVQGGTVTCPSASYYTPSGITANNLNFGFNITPSFSVVAISANGLGNVNCADSFSFNGYLQLCNLPVGIIQLNLDYGDGTSAVSTYNYVPQNTISCDNVYLYGIFPNHIYATAGNYNIVLTASVAGLTSSSSSTVTSNTCGHYSGKLFEDANANCIFDIGENPRQSEAIMLSTGGQFYFEYSDINGDYNFSIPNTFAGAQVDISPSNTSSLSCSASSTYTTTASSGTNIDFGFNAPAPSLSLFFGNNSYCGTLQYSDYFTISQCSSNGALTANVDFGDGTAPIVINNFILNSTQNGCANWSLQSGTLQHNYASYGTYTITVAVSDGSLSTSTNVIINLGPCANFNGTIFVDANSNCVSDPGEALAFQQVFIDDINGNTVGSGISDINGNYNTQFQFVNGMTYNVHPSIFGPIGTGCYNITCPSSLNYLVNTPITSNLDFGFMSNSVNFDNAVVGIGLGCCGILQAGTSRTIRVNYMNLLCADNSGDLTLTLEPNMTFNSANPAPTSVVGNLVTWSFSNLNNATWNHFVDVNVSIPFLNNNGQAYITGDTICLTSSISSTTGTDIDMTNNTLASCFYIGTAYDPNDKHGFPQGEGPNGVIAKGTDIEYMIRFQNTGAAPAQQVFILDTLDSDIDPTTIKVLGYSHNMVLSQNGNQLRFDFPNIMLPDSGSNVDASQGFVRFLAKQKSSIAYGAKINNTAYIHFDAQAAVVTNTTLHTIAIPTSVNDLDAGIKIEVYPNPLQDELHIAIPSSLSNAEITLTDAIGKTIYQSSFELNKQSRIIDISTNSFAKGVYFVNVNADGRLYSFKVNK